MTIYQKSERMADKLGAVPGIPHTTARQNHWDNTPKTAAKDFYQRAPGNTSAWYVNTRIRFSVQQAFYMCNEASLWSCLRFMQWNIRQSVARCDISI